MREFTSYSLNEIIESDHNFLLKSVTQRVGREHVENIKTWIKDCINQGKPLETEIYLDLKQGHIISGNHRITAIVEILEEIEEDCDCEVFNEENTKDFLSQEIFKDVSKMVRRYKIHNDYDLDDELTDLDEAVIEEMLEIYNAYDCNDCDDCDCE
jgi:hypothetical protein